MAYSALVLQLLLSAPGDLPEDHKDLIQRAIRLWNNQQARFYGIHFSPTDWREGGVPAFGEYAQGVLNEQIVDESDAGVVVFTDRLGTPTPDHESGTAEEIYKLRKAGKDVAVLLNKTARQPLSAHALEERARLDVYVGKLQRQAFVGDYDSHGRLGEVISSLLTRVAAKYRREANSTLASPPVPPGEIDEEPEDEDVSKGVWPRVEVAESADTDGSGRITTRRDRRLVLESNLDAPVMNVSFRYVDAAGQAVDDFDLLWDRHGSVETLPPRGAVQFPIIQAWGSPTSVLCVVEWTDVFGRRRETRASVRAA